MTAGPVFQWGPWRFERAEWRLTHQADGVVSLPGKSLELLSILLTRAPRLVTKEEILAEVWPETAVEEGNIAFRVAMLRKVLDVEGEASCIETVRARGYRFVAPLSVEEQGEDDADPRPIEPVVEPLDRDAEAAAAVSVEPAAPLLPVIVVPRPAARRRGPFVAAAVVAVLAAVAVCYWFVRPHPGVRAVAVETMMIRDGSVDVTATGSAIAARLASRITEIVSLPAMPIAQSASNAARAEASRLAGADSVLTSAATRDDDGWRIAVQLTRIADGAVLWNWSFDVLDGSAQTFTSDVAERVAVGLGRVLNVKAREVGSRGTSSAEAYDLFLQARVEWGQRTPASVQQAISLYKRAIALDPSYAQAYAGLADCYNITMSGLPPTERYPAAKANAEKAVALAPNLAEGHTSLAFLRYKLEWKWAEAETEFKRAIALDPNYALAHHWYGEFLGLIGRYDEGIAELRKALELEPRSQAIMGDLTPALLRAGRVAEAKAVLDEAAAINPDWPWALMRRSEILKAEGRERESLDYFWRWMLLSGSSLETVDELRAAYRRGGRAEMTRAQIRQLLEIEAKSPGGFRTATELSYAYGRLGQRAEAFHWLNIALDRHEDAAIHLIGHPDYASLRGDPEFDRMLVRVGLKK